MKKSNTKGYSNLFTRFFYAWGSPHFLENTVMKEKTSGRTWGFWFLWNTILTLIIIVGAWAISLFAMPELQEEVQSALPEFTMEMKDNILSTDLPEPYVIHEETQSDSTLFVVDTKGETYTQESLSAYNSGAIIKAYEIILKEGPGEYKTIPFSELGEEPINFTFTKGNLFEVWEEYQGLALAIIFAIFGVILWIFLALIRLAIALWWALVFWAVGSLVKIKDWGFEKSYLSVLNLYFIPLILEIILLFAGVDFMFSTLIFFSIVFGFNFWKMKKSK